MRRQAVPPSPAFSARLGPVYEPSEDGWTVVMSRRAKREARSVEDPLGGRVRRRSGSNTARSTSSSLPTRGWARPCFRCNSPEHVVASCPLPRRRRRPPTASPPSSSRGLRASASAPATMSFLGHPTTRDEEDSCFIATTYDLDRERLDWENTTIVAWVIAAPSGMDRTDVEDVFRRKYRLRESELMVSSHFPEQFLVKFSSAELRNEVMCTERCNFKLDGLDVH
ncbi:hypothetical protein QYE76_055089 [Lolium multiflorum]|uniref:CCHC-type domain-containing protein n=1 Tax=Lolium multiflorum TaxID=4521 RepID=A0AAD8T0D0_LOLMU|nr:hypothetical protein QYE76_055089 [Lolium multiflorum]